MFSLTPGNYGCSGYLPDCEFKDGFVLDDQSFPTFLEEQSVCPLPGTLVAIKQSALATKSSPIIPHLNFADLFDLVLRDTLDGVGQGGGNLLHEAARQSGDNN